MLILAVPTSDWLSFFDEVGYDFSNYGLCLVELVMFSGTKIGGKKMFSR